jgi:tol-pal system protein YbgF
MVRRSFNCFGGCIIFGRVLRSQPSMSRSLALAFVALLAAGCATRASYHRLTADVDALRAEVTELRQAQQAATRDVARATAESRALEARLTELSGAQAVAASELATLRERVQTAETELREARAPAVAVTPPPVTPPPTVTPPPAASRAAAPTPAPVERPRSGTAARGTGPGDTAARDTGSREGAPQAYEAAMKTFRAREYGQAVLEFVDFMAKYPRHPLAANAQYWIGEAYYVQRDYRQALTEFQKVPHVVAASPKVPDALLKVGLCYRNLRDESRARQTWDRVVKDYPKSQAAGQAGALLRGKAAAAR